MPLVALLQAAGDGEEAPWWVLLVAIAGLLVVILTIAIAGRRKGLRVVAPDPGWKPKARQAYAESRWLADTMTEELAVWSADRRFDGSSDEQSDFGEATKSLPHHMDQARTGLYGLEAAAPDFRSARVARSVLGSLNQARLAFDSRVEARVNFRTVAGDDTRPVAEARDRELRSGQELAAAREALSAHLADLLPLT